MSLPIEQQLASVLSCQEVARLLKCFLEKMFGCGDRAVMSEITDGALYRKQREVLNVPQQNGANHDNEL